jgi:hypothetical protein
MPGHRHMYYATGLPGWMRFGFSPGWIGRSPTGLGPCATYLMTGAWGLGFMPGPGDGAPFMGGMSKDDELSFLKQHAEWLCGRVEAINKRIQELEGETG